MKNNNMKKGAVLIMVIMITTIITIIAAGLITTIRSNSDITYSAINRTNLFYAAEAGATYNIKWLKNLTYDNLMDTTYANIIAETYTSANTTFQEYENDITVSLSANVTNTNGLIEWELISTSEQNGKKCIITRNDIRPANAFQYCNFTGSALFDNWAVYFTTSQNWFGKSYWEGKIPLGVEKQTIATFFGLAETASTKHSTKGIDSGNDTWLFGEDPTNILETYADGLNMFNTTGINTVDKLNTLLNKGFRDGYKSGIAPQPMEDMAEPWVNITNPTLFNTHTIDTTLFANNADIYIKFEDSKIYMSSSNSFLPSSSYEIAQGEQEILAIPSKYNDVHIFGEISHDISVITQSDDILIEGDIYATDYSDFTELKDNDFDTQGGGGGTNSNIQDKIEEIRAINSEIEIGLIAGLEENSIFRILSTDKTDLKNDAILITAGLFVPLGDSNNGDLCASYASFSNEVHMLLFGAFVAKNGEGTTTNGRTGVNPSYAGDPKFMNGYRAPGFKTSVETDPITGNPLHVFTDNMTWSIAWEY